MTKESKLDVCRRIYMREVTTTDKLPKQRRQEIVGMFVTEANVKLASANVYFTNIKKSIGAVEAPVLTKPVTGSADQLVDKLMEDTDGIDPATQGDFERDFTNSLAIAQED